MYAQPNIAAVAALIADRTRAAMLDCLMDGRALTAKELAYSAEVTPQTASGHLAKLNAAGLVRMEAQGRNRYFRLANSKVAQALESLALLSTRSLPAKRVTPRAPDALRKARSCYDHLAGRTGVAVTAALMKQRVLIPEGRDFVLSPKGERLMATLGIGTAPLRGTRRAFARQCLDWTERKVHLAGALGAALTSFYLEQGWLTRPDDSRALALTRKGAKAFATHFGVQSV